MSSVCQNDWWQEETFIKQIICFLLFRSLQLTILSIGLTKCYRHVFLHFNFTAICDLVQMWLQLWSRASTWLTHDCQMAANKNKAKLRYQTKPMQVVNQSQTLCLSCCFCLFLFFFNFVPQFGLGNRVSTYGLFYCVFPGIKKENSGTFYQIVSQNRKYQ